jgi:hypothetical protein
MPQELPFPHRIANSVTVITVIAATCNALPIRYTAAQWPLTRNGAACGNGTGNRKVST